MNSVSRRLFKPGSSGALPTVRTDTQPPSSDSLEFLKSVIENYRVYIKELREKNATLEAMLSDSCKEDSSTHSPKLPQLPSRARAPSLSTFGTKTTYKDLMKDEFFSERSQQIPPSSTEDISFENKYSELYLAVEFGLGKVMSHVGKLQQTIAKLPLAEHKAPLHNSLHQIISLIIPLVDLMSKTKLKTTSTSADSKPSIPPAPRTRPKKIKKSPPVNVAPLKQAQSSPALVSPSPVSSTAKRSPRKRQSFLSEARVAPNSKLSSSSPSKPLPPSRKDRPALKDVSVFSDELPSVEVSLGHFKRTKQPLRPFEVPLEDDRRRYTVIEELPKTRPKRIRRWNSGPNLNSWEMPKSIRSNFTPPVFKTENTKENDAQALLKRQSCIQYSLQIQNSSSSNLQSPLTFALTDDNRSLLVGGDIYSVFEWILERSSDWDEVESILLFHRQFCTAEGLAKVLLAWYENVSSRSPFVKLQRASEIIEKWVTLYPNDFIKDKQARQILTEFIECGKLVDLRTAENLKKMLFEAKEPPLIPIQPIIVSLASKGKSMDILNIPALEIAKYFANTGFVHFQNVRWNDLITAKAREKSKSLDLLIKKFTYISLWIGTEIVRTAHTKKRGSVIRHFINLAQICLEIRDFAGLSAIIAGLNMTAIQRLKKSWKTIPKSSTDQLTSLEGYVMPYNNFEKYRTALKAAPKPCLPFIGVYCRDLTHVEEGNPDYLENGHVNLEKMRIKTAILKEIRDFQSVPYNFVVSQSTTDYFSHVSSLSFSSREIKNLSFQIEPRNDV